MVLSGFVPGLAFVVEHRVVKQMKAEWAEEGEWPDAEPMGSAVSRDGASSDQGRPISSARANDRIGPVTCPSA